MVLVLDGAAGWLCSLCAYRLRVAWLAAVLVLLCWGAAVSAASASLPDGRAWEMVSPLEKNGGEVNGIAHGGEVRGVEGDNGGGVVQASSDGQKITYVSKAAFRDPQGAPTGSQYAAMRDKNSGWQTQNITIPSNDQSYLVGGVGAPYRAFSLDLSSGLVFGGIRSGHRAHPVENPPLAPGAPAGYENYYLYGIPGGALQPLLTHAPSVPPEAFELEFLGSAPDLNHVVLRSPAVLAAGAVETGKRNLYEWERAPGQFRAVNVLPNGTPASESPLFLGSGGGGPAISEDGSRVVWTGGPNLYVRKNIGQPQSPVDSAGNCTDPTGACTVQADAPAGQGSFLTASSDDRKVFFADRERLTGDSTASGGGVGDLYRFEPEAAPGGRLVDLTVDHIDPGGAEVQGVLGASEDGSYVYFVANGVLAPGAARGSCVVNSPLGLCNLYLWHEGWKEPKFITALSGNDQSGFGTNSLGVAFDWSSNAGVRTARVSRDGMRVVFVSERSLTGYDNTVSTGSSCGKRQSGEPLATTLCEEVFLYEASGDELGSGRLSCVSCNPTGARPSGPSGIPGGTEFENNQALYQSRVLSEGVAGSRVFFDSADALVPQDTNGAEDVYEYENGNIYLLSDGKSTNGASFVDASVNGNDVFFVTRAQLAAQDTDQLVDLYDARAPHELGEQVGFPVTATTACAGEDCLPVGATEPVFAAPSSAASRSSENVVPVSTPVAKHKLKKKKKLRKRKTRGKSRHGKKAGARLASGSRRG